MGSRVYTKDGLIRQLLMLAEELGRAPTAKEFDEDARTATHMTASKLFGSWKKSLEAAGLEVNRRWSRYTEEELIRQVLMLAEELGRTPTSIEFDEDARTASSATASKLFGSWNKFLKAAGLGINHKQQGYTKDELIQQVLMLAEELGRTPTSIEFNEDARTVNVSTIYNFFGSWKKFLETVGLEINCKRPRYKEEELIQQVLMLAEELGRAPTSIEFNEDARTATRVTTNKFFGSWGEFLKAAGLEVNRKRPRYTEEGLIRQVLMLAEELGRTPTSIEFDEDARTASSMTASKLFGSWNKLLKAAGLEINHKQQGYTEDELIQQVLMLAEELGRTPTSIEFNEDARTVNVSTIYNFFGSWKKFLETAGLEVNCKRPRYTEEELIKQVLMLAEELGRAPTQKEFNEDTRTASSVTASKLFGSWKKFLEAAGLEVNRKRPRYTEEELIRQVLMLAEELGRAPTSTEFNEDTRTPNACTIYRFFGSWNKLLKAAGLEINHKQQGYTEDELIQQVLMLAEELGRAPTNIEFNEDPKTVNVSAIYRLFGSWKKFLETAGLKVNYKRPRYTEEELIQQVLMLAEELGRAPMVKEFNEDPKTVNVSAIYRLFGSWGEFLKAAGLKSNPINRPQNTK